MVDGYLALLGVLLAAVAALVAILAIATRAGWTRRPTVSTALGAGSGIAAIVLGLGAIWLAAALLAPVLVAGVAIVMLVAIGYAARSFLRQGARPGDRMP